MNVKDLIKIAKSEQIKLWIANDENGNLIGAIESRPYLTFPQRLDQMICEHYDLEEAKIEGIDQFSAMIGTVINVYIPTDIEDGYTEKIAFQSACIY